MSIPFDRAIPDAAALVDRVVADSPNPASEFHGAAHWRGVASVGLRLLAAGATAEPTLLFLFSLLHDSRRESEHDDPEHGERAADYASRLRGDLVYVDNEDFSTLTGALIDHDRGYLCADATIGACWDADRLTLPRVGIAVDGRFLSTAAGRSLLPAARDFAYAAPDWESVIRAYAAEAG